jgi:hypothetical protein
MIECRKRSDWDKWKVANEAELRSLCKEKCLSLQSQHFLKSSL